MEISDPVPQMIIPVQMGRKRVELVATSRAECRALAAAAMHAAEQLPDDGEPLAGVPQTHRHGRPADVDDAALSAAVGRGEAAALLDYVSGYCPAAIAAALESPRFGEPGCICDIASADVCPVHAARDDEPEPPAAAPAVADEPAPAPAAPAAAAAEPVDEPAPVPARVKWCGHRGADGRACKLPAHEPDEPHVPYDGRGLDEPEPEPLGVPAARTATPGRALLELVHNGQVTSRLSCPHRHPSKETACIGLDEHAEPCRDIDGDEWVPARLAVAR